MNTSNHSTAPSTDSPTGSSLPPALLNGRVLLRNITWLDVAAGTTHTGNIALVDGRIVALSEQAATDIGTGIDFTPDCTHDASDLVLAPRLVDLCARIAGAASSARDSVAGELAAAQAAGIGALVCPPTLKPILDTPDVVEMLRLLTQRSSSVQVHPLGALTTGLHGQALSEARALLQAGCIGLTQAAQPLINTLVLQRALQYAASCNAPVWLYPLDATLGSGVAASGDFATRLGLAGVPVAAETIAIFTILQLVEQSGARVHLCRISTAAGVELIRQAKADGLPISCDVSINNLHLLDQDIGYYDSACRLIPPLRQQRDRDALQHALADGTIDALVSDHTVVGKDAKILPFAQAELGASGMELLLPLALRWGREQELNLAQSLSVISHRAAQIAAITYPAVEVSNHLKNLLLFRPEEQWQVTEQTLHSHSKSTPFAFHSSGFHMQGKALTLP